MHQLNAQIALLEAHTRRLIAVLRTRVKGDEMAADLRADLQSILQDLVVLKSCREEFEKRVDLRNAA